METRDRTRIFSHITRSRFLHLEDALQPAAEGKPGKIRFFIGQYRRRDQGGQGAEATAYHFLDDSEARVIFTDMSCGKQLDITDYKGTVNGGGPQSRVLKIKGPTDKGKYWIQVSMGPGEVIGQGAVKPKGKPEVEVSIPLAIWEARKLALAVIEYMAAWRVAAMIGDRDVSAPGGNCPQSRTVDPTTGEITSAAQDADDLFGPEPASAPPDPPASRPKAEEPPAEVDPPTFFALANEAIKSGFDLAKLQEIIKSQVPWREKHITLSQAMAA